MKSIVVVSDLHIGSTVGLCPPVVKVVDASEYRPNRFQESLYRVWCSFWGEYVPRITKGASKVYVVINGDVIDNVHHNTVNIISNSLEVQEAAAIKVLNEVPRLCPVGLTGPYFVAGTDAHAGQAAESERRIAKNAHGLPDESGDIVPYERWIDVDGVTFHFAHTISTTSSAAYESSAPMRELVTGMVEAVQWNRPMPDIFVRSHRHRFIEVPLPTVDGRRIRLVVTPGWQLKTPYSYRGDRMRMSHIGGVVFNILEERQCQVREIIYPTPLPQPTKV